MRLLAKGKAGIWVADVTLQNVDGQQRAVGHLYKDNEHVRSFNVKVMNNKFCVQTRRDAYVATFNLERS